MRHRTGDSRKEMEMTGLPLFDAAASQAAKEAGMARAADKRPAELEYARTIAKQIARVRGEVTADDVQAVLQAEGIELKNAAGSIFRDPAFEWTGRFHLSTRKESHRNRLLTWRLKK
jgi:hypothetical protein